MDEQRRRGAAVGVFQRRLIPHLVQIRVGCGENLPLGEQRADIARAFHADEVRNAALGCRRRETVRVADNPVCHDRLSAPRHRTP